MSLLGRTTKDQEKPKTSNTAERFDWRDNLRGAGTLIGLVLIVLVFSSQSPIFLTGPNIINILQSSAINACIAIGMTLVIISGGIDLSVGPIAALAAVVSATLMFNGTAPLLAVPVGLGIGITCGIVNGLLIARVGLQPFIVTLGTLSLYRALALIYTGGNPILSVPKPFRDFFNGNIGGIPMPVILVALASLVAWVILRKTPLGEYLLAVGGNEEAARVNGVPVILTKVSTYAVSGFLAALAALILVGRLGAAEPILGNQWELNAIAASAIGGTSLMGGKGSIIGTLMGAIILGAMINGLTLMNVQAFYQLLATGIIILLAMIVDRITRGTS
ncbi:MAG: ABC transporter permease [Anaerolineae bacterium]|nr:ABC transporter permease [Anaerolineae bacterium]MDW8172092.1 ABC transporter permease [Anaerolineae bacterium]